MARLSLWIAWGCLLAISPSFAQDVIPPGGDEGVDQSKVNAAIEKGIAWIKSQQTADGKIGVFTHQGQDYEQNYPGGTTALGLLTLIKSGVPKDDPVIVKGFDYIKNKTTLVDPTDKDKTYCVAILILALEAINDPGGQMDEKTAVKAKNLDSEKKAWMRRLHAWLIKNRTEYESNKDGEGKPFAKPGSKSSTGSSSIICICWGYPNPNVPGTGVAPQGDATHPIYDNSNTQIALLALKACSRVGIETPKQVWKGVLYHFLRLQEQDGPPVKRVGIDDSGKTTDVDTDDKCRGFPYRGASDFTPHEFGWVRATHNMVCAGLGSLLICRSELLSDSEYKNRLGPVVDTAVRDSLAWLGVMFPQFVGKPAAMDLIRKDPNPPAAPPDPPRAPKNKKAGNDGAPAGGLNYYGLYSVERVATLAKTKNIGHSLWYAEGANKLIEVQLADGSWGDHVSTCFALLFLKKATFIVTGESYQERAKKKE